MKTIKNYSIYLMLFAFLGLNACNKNWLNGKPSKALVIPTSPEDYQSLLDNPAMNDNYASLYMLGDGDFYLTDSVYASLDQPEIGAYTWAETKSFYGGQKNYDLLQAYSNVLDANVVLDGIKSLQTQPSTIAVYNNVKGSALFYRSNIFYDLAQMFCKVYNSATANTDLGLPLRVSANVNLVINRSSVQQTYDQIINDLLTAARLLPVTQLYPTRPSKPAVFGLLARVYLSQQNYTKALLYADSCLSISNTLVDFNTLNPTKNYPIPRFNNEVIFHNLLCNYEAFSTGLQLVDSVLYQSYASNDLRRNIYFTPEPGGFSFRGSYNGNSEFFGGVATDEMYLIRAECYARAGNTTSAMNDINSLLKTRWVTGTYTNLTASSSDSALILILNERRKELCFRGFRWTDLRRLNNDPRFQITLTRIINGQTYTLPPNSTRYVLPIDDYEIQYGGLVQNPR
ncbi:RagB/SusD family nutrient uptake outer membrane protein [Mucilaginibacter sp. L196]|uniref:RagB/SusD family nutrient uptake outer membrane protein n=1 Tax=Mucilaginibacter sp. L196 TaxID=1641870 RepID=UPI00131D135F|nr:RagB/SusD family nutrient uptake outer membrane protein [Mucilaginibacter sp. L196]